MSAGAVVPDREPQWEPLERFAAVADGVVVGDFMWISTFAVDGGVVIEEYKHVGTRRHLRLDSHGHAWDWSVGDGFTAMASPTVAVADVLDCGTALTGWEL